VSDTLQQRTTVTVSPELRILQLFAFPNPFAAVTQLTFVLAGSDQPERTRIRIFTVAGRRIRLIDLQGSAARIGVNRVPWDGRDDDGDLIANGVYFCQVEVLSGGKTVTAIGKLAKVR
jgi:flagellar hook assembly protein FlgD